MLSEFTRVDLAILLWLNSFVGRWPLFDDVVRVISEWNFLRAAWLGLFLVWAWAKFSDHESRLKLMAGLAGLFVATALSRLLQIALAVHPRPFTMVEELGLNVPRKLLVGWGHGNCYPSDTASLYFAFAAMIFSVSRAWGALAMAWVAIVICLPRVYLLYHWPSDIAAGLALGIACVVLLQTNRHVMPTLAQAISLEKLRPHLFYPVMFLVLYQIIDSFDAVEQILHHIGAVRKHGALG